MILYDDLFVPILSKRLNIDIALFDDSTIYGGEKGYFIGPTFENIGGILFLDCQLPSEGIKYRQKFVANPNAKEAFSFRA